MIYVTGDTHGTVPFGYVSVDGISRRFGTAGFPEQKEMTKEDYVIICGDFGCVWNYDSRYDPGRNAFKEVVCFDHGESKEEKHWLDWLDRKPFTTLFCDGNHENYDRLEGAYEEVDFHGGKAHRIRDSIFHLERGYVFEIDGASVFVFGGARSHDISGGIVKPSDYASERELKRALKKMNEGPLPYRVDHISWWERELPSEEEMERGLKELSKYRNKVDFIISHAGPQQVVSLMGAGEADRLTLYFDRIAETADFSRWFFGHYHENRQCMVRYVALYEQIVRVW